MIKYGILLCVSHFLSIKGRTIMNAKRKKTYRTACQIKILTKLKIKHFVNLESYNELPQTGVKDLKMFVAYLVFENPLMSGSDLGQPMACV